MKRRLVLCLACGAQYSSSAVHECEEAQELLAEMQREEEAKPQPKERLCLRCDVAFLSEGPHNRLCDVCRDDVIDEEPYFFAPMERV